MSFLPPAPKPELEAVSTNAAPLEAPELRAGYYLRETPDFLSTNMQVPPRPQLDQRIKRAEEHFQTGRRMYLEGDKTGARVEFDAVMDILLSSPESAPDRSVMERKLEQLVDKIHRYDVEGLGAGDVSENPSFDKSPLKEILEMTFPIDPKLKTKLREEVKATVSQLPLEENDEVLRYIHYFSTDRGRRTLIGGLRRAGRYSDMIRRILDEEGVPQELIYLAQAESGFLPRAVSYKAATGMWQFIQFRGREYGLMQTPYTDDRLDPEKATRAAARHLRDLYQQLGDWYLAMAAYNCGPNAVDRAVLRTGYADFWELRNRNALPRETSNYVPVILAMTIMMKNPTDYGLTDIQQDPPVEYDTVRMEAMTSLPLLSDVLEMPVSLMHDYNPALLKNLAPPGYDLRVPKGSGRSLLAVLENIPAARRANWRAHRVMDGESLASIAKNYGATVTALAAANRPGMSEPEAGDLLVIPSSYAEPRATAPVRTAAHRTAATRSASNARRPAATHAKTAQRHAVSGKTYASSIKSAPKSGPQSGSR